MDTDLSVVKSNVLIRQSYKLKKTEQQVVLYCISKIDSKAPLTEAMEFDLYAEDFVDVFDCPIQNVYTELKDAAVSLLSNGFKFTDIDGKVTETRWFQSISYIVGQGKLSVRFPYVLTPHLSELSKNFTQYSLSNVSGMRSSYGVRLYELMSQWRSTGKLDISIVDLNKYLGVNYKTINDIRTRIIEPASKDIQEHSNYVITSIDYRKTGRAITHIIIQFKTKGEMVPELMPVANEPKAAKQKPPKAAKEPAKRRTGDNATGGKPTAIGDVIKKSKPDWSGSKIKPTATPTG